MFTIRFGSGNIDLEPRGIMDDKTGMTAPLHQPFSSLAEPLENTSSEGARRSVEILS